MTKRLRAAVGGLYRINAVAKATGIPENTLRVWERRYGAISSRRSPGGYRLYTEADVARLHSIKALLEAGHSIGEIAVLPAQALARLRESSIGSPPLAGASPAADVVRGRFIEAIERHDLEEAQRLVGASMAAYAPDHFVTALVAPVLTEIGNRWEAGTLSVAQEHAASAVLRNALGALLKVTSGGRGIRLLVTTPEGELHEFGALIAAVVASAAGARVAYLGPSTPASDLASAAQGIQAEAVTLSVVGLESARAYKALTAVRKAVPRNIEVWAGGNGLKEAPRGIRIIRTLAELRQRIGDSTGS